MTDSSATQPSSAPTGRRRSISGKKKQTASIDRSSATEYLTFVAATARRRLKTAAPS